MIGIDDQYRIQVFRGQFRIVFCAKDRHNLRKALFRCTLVDLVYFTFQNIFGIDLSLGSNTRGEVKCKVPSAGPNIPNNAPLLDPESVHDLLRLLPEVARFRIILTGTRPRCASKDRYQQKPRKASSSGSIARWAHCKYSGELK